MCKILRNKDLGEQCSVVSGQCSVIPSLRLDLCRRRACIRFVKEVANSELGVAWANPDRTASFGCFGLIDILAGG